MTIIEYNASTVAIELRIEGDDKTSYPKSYKVYNLKIWAQDAKTLRSYIAHLGVHTTAYLRPNGVMGKVNETGLARLEKFVKHAIKLHGPVQFKRINNFINNIELPAAIGGLGEVLS